MNYKLEKFWNTNDLEELEKEVLMNYKLEKFWNLLDRLENLITIKMNYKLEKFWNTELQNIFRTTDLWTINLKSFEIWWSLCT